MPIGYMGHVRAKNKNHLKLLSLRRHGVQAIPKTLPASWDSRTKGWIGPVKNQGGCGSCWDFSGTFVVECAYNVAGVGGGPDKLILSEEYTLSCGQNGGCNGDDNVTVLEWAKKTGLPLSSDYGSYTASADSCNFKQSMTLYKLDDWGFSDGTAGYDKVTPTDAIKRDVMEKGCVGCAVAAGGSDWWNDGKGTCTGTSNGINHDVAIVGWDDAHDNGDGSKGAWIVRNSWGSGWGEQGYGWMKYGADSIGTEAVWAYVRSVNPPIDVYFV